MTNCIKCGLKCVINGKPKDNEVLGFPCDYCRKILCKNCADITTTEARCVALSQRVLLFYCPDCIVSIQEIPKLKGDLKTLQAEVDKLKEFFHQTTQVPTYAEILSNFKTETKAIKDDINNLEIKFAKSKSNDSNQELNTNLDKQAEVEPTIYEIQEREKRAANILIFGVKEEKIDNAEERIELQKKSVVNIIKSVNKDVPTENIKIYRLGKYNQDKVRPIKVTFSSKADALQVLRYKNKLPTDTGRYIKYDQTALQREYLKKVLAEMEGRKAKGEVNLKIKYINQIPKIIKVPDTKDKTCQKPKN